MDKDIFTDMQARIGCSYISGLALLQTGSLVRDEAASPCRLSKTAARGLFTLCIRREVCYLNRSDGTFRKDVMKKQCMK